jgi:hypothetical protein
VRTVGRTAVIAGTASAVAGGVHRRQRNRWAAQDQQDAAAQQDAYQQGLADAQAAAAPPPQPAPAAPDPLEELERLGKLRDQGVLTDAEFEAQKAKILAG